MTGHCPGRHGGVDDERGPDLVEPEGVNAASGAVLPDDSGEDRRDVRRGGSAGRADEQDVGVSPPELLGPPRQEPGTPGQELSAGEG